MFHSITTIVIIILGVLIAAFAVKLLFNKTWLMGWIRGCCGILLIACSAVLALAALDFFSYRAIVAEKSVATLQFNQVEPQKYSVQLLTASGDERSFELFGDQWQLDARIIKWPALLSSMGVKPSYRLERLSGRYFSWEQELNAPRSVHPLAEQEFGLDLWHWSQTMELSDIGIDATYGSATYLPMADGALYEVSLSHTGLVARPFNKVAEDAINRWQ